MRDVILKRLGNLRHGVHTLTAGNGKAFAEHSLIATALRADVYFVDPYPPWQRGSNQNANGLARQYLPRHMDFSSITPERLTWIEQRHYNQPRKVLKFKTLLDVFSEGISKTFAFQS